VLWGWNLSFLAHGPEVLIWHSASWGPGRGTSAASSAVSIWSSLAGSLGPPQRITAQRTQNKHSVSSCVELNFLVVPLKKKKRETVKSILVIYFIELNGSCYCFNV
jgi:hypothetical protein